MLPFNRLFRFGSYRCEPRRGVRYDDVDKVAVVVFSAIDFKLFDGAAQIRGADTKFDWPQRPPRILRFVEWEDHELSSPFRD
jgi:hypothetical protein